MTLLSQDPTKKSLLYDRTLLADLSQICSWARTEHRRQGKQMGQYFSTPTVSDQSLSNSDSSDDTVAHSVSLQDNVENNQEENQKQEQEEEKVQERGDIIC